LARTELFSTSNWAGTPTGEDDVTMARIRNQPDCQPESDSYFGDNP
jgi:hypothetical protein